MPVYRQNSDGVETWTPDNSRIGRRTAGTKNVHVHTLPAHNRKWTELELKQYLALKHRYGVLTPVLSICEQRIPERTITAVNFQSEPERKVTQFAEHQVTAEELEITSAYKMAKPEENSNPQATSSMSNASKAVDSQFYPVWRNQNA